MAFSGLFQTQNRKPLCYNLSFWKQCIPSNEGLPRRYCYKGTFTQHTFLGQEAKEFYSLLTRIQKKRGLGNQEKYFFCHRVGREKERDSRVWIKGKWTELGLNENIVSFEKWEHPQFFGFQASNEEVPFLLLQFGSKPGSSGVINKISGC